MGFIPALIFQKPDFGGSLSTRVENLENNESIYQLFQFVGQSTTGQVTIPTGATIFDIYGDGILDAIVVEADINQNPTNVNSTNSSGQIVQVTSLNNNGDYTLDSLPTVNACLLYFIKIKAADIVNIPLTAIVEAGIPLVQTSYGVLTVGLSNADFTSVKAACDYAATVATVNTPFWIQIVGRFIENPFVIPAYTKLLIHSGSIIAADNASPLITISGSFSEIKGGNIVGPSSSDTILVTAGSTAIKDVVISGNGNCGIKVQNVPSPSRCLIRNATVTGHDKGFCVDNSFVIVTTSSSSLATVSSIEISNLSSVIIDSFVSVASALALSILDASTVRMNASQMRSDDIRVADWTNVYLSYTSDKENDEALSIVQELHVGTPDKPAESIFGAGDSHTFEFVYTFDGVSTYTDKTTEAKSYSGSTFQFDGITAGNAMYIANEYDMTFEGIKVDIDTAAGIGIGSIIAEYWNGTIWVEFNGCTVKSSPGFLKFAKNYFNQSGAYHIKYNPFIRDSWVKNDPVGLGTNYYWMRFRIVADIASTPILNQIKIHTNRTELNTDGTQESHMDARVYKKLTVDAVRPLEGSMQNASIYVDENIGVGLENNRFTSVGDLLGVSFELPEDCDTSAPIIFVWKGKFATAGTVDFTVRRRIVPPKGLYSNSEPAASGEAVTVTTGSLVIDTANSRRDFRVDLDISDAIPSRSGSVDPFDNFGDEIWITLQYPTRGGGNFDYTKLSANYLSDFAGRHVRQ